MYYFGPHRIPFLRLFATVLLALSGLAPLHASQSNAAAAPAVGPVSTLRLEIQPAPAEEDPGPTWFVQTHGALSDQRGPSFLGVDVYLSDASARWRMYFDYHDAANYHYLERDGASLTLGLCESGVPQVLAVAAWPAGGDASTLRLARHGMHIGVFMAHQLLLRAFDSRRQGGAVGLRDDGTASKPKLRAEAHDDVYFADDFMREDNQTSRWRPGPGEGRFEIKSLRHPLLSANAFCLMGEGTGAMTVLGEPWWDFYAFDVALRGHDGQQIGLVCCYKDPQNYGLFRWSARNAEDPSQGRRELVLVQNGHEQILQSALGGYLPGQWYKARVSVSYEKLRVRVDGHTLFECAHPALTAGGVGLWCNVPLPEKKAVDPKALPFAMNSLKALMEQHAVFDDVKVTTLQELDDDFRTPGPLAHGWLTGAGTWNAVAAPGLPGVLEVRPGAAAAKSLVARCAWARSKVSVDLDPAGGQAGVVLLYQDESHHYVARTDGATLSLLKVTQASDGRVHTAVVASALHDPQQWKAARASTGGLLRLDATLHEGHILVRTADGAEVQGFEADGRMACRAGLWAAGADLNAPLRFARFRWQALAKSDPLVTTNAIFDEERSMSAWTDTRKEWVAPRSKLKINGREASVLWHSGQFPGDVELSVEPRQIETARHEIALSVAKDGSGSNNGYVFKYQAGLPDEPLKDGKATNVKNATKDGQSADAPDAPPLRLTLLRNGQTVAQQTVSAKALGPLSSAAVRRAGDYVIGKLNGRPAIVYRDPEPLHGSKVAFYTLGVRPRTEATSIHSEHYHEELFSRAPVSWRTDGAAIAEVTNRWQCDPRWSFFSLKNDRKQGHPAVLWCKKLYHGDFSVECYVANKMERERGAPYTYARDINLTICSDGKDLRTGYTFNWGGEKNTCTRILRNGVEVARHTATVPTSKKYHHHWFHLRVEKRGDRLSFRVDKYFAGEPKGEMVFHDVKPLEGGHVALWTYDHAVMISKVRISGTGGVSQEHPDFAPDPGTLQTFYDAE